MICICHLDTDNELKQDMPQGGVSCISSAQPLFIAYCNIRMCILAPKGPRPVIKSQQEHKECANIPRKDTDMIVVVVL